MIKNSVFLSRSIRKSLNYFHTSNSLCGNPYLAMRKVLGYTKKRKKIYSEGPLLQTPKLICKNSDEGKLSNNTRRINVLNKLFMRYITDIMACSENSNEYLGYGFEITRVKVEPNYKGIKVYWIVKDNVNNIENIENILQKISKYIRHELSTLKVMGQVPKIFFKKDTIYRQTADIDILLSRADFGDDHKPPEITHKLRCQLELHLELGENTKEQINMIDNNNDNNINNDYYVPEMPGNIFGLNYTDIMGRITKSIQKSHAIHRLDDNHIVPGNSPNNNTIDYSTNKEKREAFKNFLLKREILRTKLMKNRKKSHCDLNYNLSVDDEDDENDAYFNDISDHDYLSESE